MFSDVKKADTGPLLNIRLGNMLDIISCQIQKGANNGGRSAGSEDSPIAIALSFAEKTWRPTSCKFLAKIPDRVDLAPESIR